jgi:hypothetical protein
VRTLLANFGVEEYELIESSDNTAVEVTTSEGDRAKYYPWHTRVTMKADTTSNLFSRYSELACTSVYDHTKTRPFGNGAFAITAFPPTNPGHCRGHDHDTGR